MSRWFRWLGWCVRIFAWQRREALVEPWNAITVRVYAGPVTLPPMGLEGIPVLPADPVAPPVAVTSPATPSPAPDSVAGLATASGTGIEEQAPAAARTAA